MVPLIYNNNLGSTKKILSNLAKSSVNIFLCLPVQYLGPDTAVAIVEILLTVVRAER